MSCALVHVVHIVHIVHSSARTMCSAQSALPNPLKNRPDRVYYPAGSESGSEIVETKRYDVVVVGGGTAGIAAGVAASLACERRIVPSARSREETPFSSSAFWIEVLEG